MCQAPRQATQSPGGRGVAQQALAGLLAQGQPGKDQSSWVDRALAGVTQQVRQALQNLCEDRLAQQPLTALWALNLVDKHH